MQRRSHIRTTYQHTNTHKRTGTHKSHLGTEWSRNGMLPIVLVSDTASMHDPIATLRVGKTAIYVVVSSRTSEKQTSGQLGVNCGNEKNMNFFR